MLYFPFGVFNNFKLLWQKYCNSAFFHSHDELKLPEILFVLSCHFIIHNQVYFQNNIFWKHTSASLSNEKQLVKSNVYGLINLFSRHASRRVVHQLLLFENISSISTLLWSWREEATSLNKHWKENWIEVSSNRY